MLDQPGGETSPPVTLGHTQQGHHSQLVTAQFGHNLVFIVAQPLLDISEEPVRVVSVVGGQQPVEIPAESHDPLAQELLPAAAEYEVDQPLSTGEVHEEGMFTEEDGHHLVLTVQGGQASLLQQERPHPGPGPELAGLAETQAGGEGGAGEETSLQQRVDTGEHGRAHPPQSHLTLTTSWLWLHSAAEGLGSRQLVITRQNS